MGEKKRQVTFVKVNAFTIFLESSIKVTTNSEHDKKNFRGINSTFQRIHLYETEFFSLRPIKVKVERRNTKPAKVMKHYRILQADFYLGLHHSALQRDAGKFLVWAKRKHRGFS